MVFSGASAKVPLKLVGLASVRGGSVSMVPYGATHPRAPAAPTVQPKTDEKMAPVVDGSAGE